MHRGYVRLYRKIEDLSWWRRGKFTWGQAWVDMIMMAMHTDQSLVVDYKEYFVPAGSFVTSQRKLASRWRWSISTVNLFLNFLQKTEHSIELKTEHSFTHISLTKWDDYQFNPNTESNNKSKGSRTVVEHFSKQIKNDKNEKNEKKEPTPIQALVSRYKEIKGIPPEDKTWDKTYFARNAKSAKQLLTYVGDLGAAIECLVSVSGEMKEKGLDWTLETILKRADKWKLGRVSANEEERKRKEATERAKEFISAQENV